jgi:hypothetical protein
MNAVPDKQEWGELGPAMQALPNDRWRDFVRHYVTGKPGHGASVRAYRLAGFGKKSKPATQGKEAHHMIHDERVIAAIAEMSRQVIRAGYPEAVSAWFNLVRNPKHRDHGRAVALFVERLDPAVSRHAVDVTHRTIDPDREALEELRAARKLGATREKLVELYGANGLDRLEALDAVDLARRADAAKIIEHQPEASHD